ncbi:MAG: hypothetical protein GVY10_12225 [Verrucomicrobia bacterium]|jgi:hypothetical protein|nr:hypothetical protein [Verrucomicrobiota bacterium]
MKKKTTTILSVEARVLLTAGFVFAGLTLHGQPLNPHAVLETPAGWVASPDLDDDGEPDLVLLDREDGVLRAALVSGGATNWLTPVASGIAEPDAFAAGPFGPSALAAVAVTKEEANRINLFDVTGGGLEPVPQTLYPTIVGTRELTALPEGSADDDGTSTATAPWELLTYSQIHDPTDSGGDRRLLRRSAGGVMEEYSTTFEIASQAERGHGNFWVEEGLPMLGLYRESATPGQDFFRLYYTEDGDFDLVDTVTVNAGAEVVHASFDDSGAFQFVFHVPGSDQIEVFGWDGSQLNLIGTFNLSAPAAALFPFADGSAAGLLAIPMSSSGLREYSFDGASAPVFGQLLSPASGLPVTGALARPDGNLFVFSSDEDSGKVEAAELFEHDGNGFNSATQIALPASPGGASNVLLFADTPFIEENPELTGRWQTGVWTSGVSLPGGSVEAEEESFGGPAAGLGNPVTRNLGSPPAGTVAVLGNQVTEDISLHDPRPAAGELKAGFEVTPGSGEYRESVTAQILTKAGGTNVVYRILPDGEWDLAGNAVGPFYEETQLQFVGINGSQWSPMQTVHYQFTEGPGELDSDEDGVPDFVEDANGLDPIASEDDGDGDGFSDFLELMAGTSPTDDTDTPLSRELDSDGDGYSDFEEQLAGTDPGNASSAPSASVLNLQSVFDLVAVPQSHDGTSAVDPFVASLDEATEGPGDAFATPVRLYNLAGSLLGYDRTRDHGISGVTDPSALIGEIAPGENGLPMVVATGRNFPVDVAAPDNRIGRQIAALVMPPDLEAPDFTYSFGSAGGDPAAEAAAWVSSVKSQLLSLSREQTVRAFDLYDTLVLLLVEARLEQILEARGLLPAADRMTLTGFRTGEDAVALAAAPGDGSRAVQPGLATFRDVQREFGGVDTGYQLGIVFDSADGIIQSPPNGNVSALRQVAEAIYRVSAAQANDDPGSLLPPMEALRRFVRTGSLADTGYPTAAPGAPFDATTLGSASAGVAYVLAQGLNRPVSTLALTITGSTDGGPDSCTVLLDDALGQDVSLVDFKGNPFVLPDAFEMPAGSVLEVRGYTDVPADCGADLGMEVIPTVDLVSLPGAPAGDADNDLIADDLEDLYTGPLSAYNDSDGDGYSDLQETLEGTHPLDSGSTPAGPPVDLEPPEIELTQDGAGDFVFTFDFPADYASDIGFQLYSSTGLSSFPTDEGMEAGHLGGGAFELEMPNPGEGSLPEFYRFLLFLK